MRAGGRIQAAIDVLTTVDAQHRPVAEVLKDWGNAHRFAGSGDRAAIGNLVFDALRWRASSAWRMGDDTPRATILSVVVHRWGWTLEALDELLATDNFGPDPLTDADRQALAGSDLSGAPDVVRADVPEWAAQHLEATFGADWIGEAEALAARAPIDLRANVLKAPRDKVVRALARFNAVPTPYSPLGARIAMGREFERPANVVREPGYQKGWFEVQDEGSQLAVLLAGSEPGEQILDFCAGAGGKTLALAAEMGNRGQVHAFDSDRSRLQPIFERLRRAGTRNVHVHAADADLSGLEGRMDRVLVDAPCTGSGVWRRRPDAKWRLSAEALATRQEEQRAVLDAAARHVRPGGRLVYVTCSLFDAENSRQIEAFLDRAPGFAPVPAERLKGEALTAVPARDVPLGLLLSPAATQTDGFFVAALERRVDA